MRSVFYALICALLCTVAFSQGMVDFGLKLDIDLPFDGKWESNEYSGNGFNGGWYNNASMLDFFTVISMNSNGKLCHRHELAEEALLVIGSITPSGFASISII